jgi:hypothetical protein
MFARNLVPLFALALSGALALADGDGTEPGAPGEESPAAEPIAAPSAEQEVAVPLELGTPGRDGTRIGYSSARRVEAETTVPRFLFDTTAGAAGSALIIHANEDDQATDATNGGSGGRIACAVIEAG